MPINYTSGTTDNSLVVSGAKDTGTATAGAAKTLTCSSKSWTTNAYTFHIVWITSGTGAGQHNYIVSNTATVLTCLLAWTTNPDATSVFAIGYAPQDLVAEQPTYCAHIQEVAAADLKNQVIINTDTRVYVPSGGYFGCWKNPVLIFGFEFRGLESDSGANIVFGHWDIKRERGCEGGLIQNAFSLNAPTTGGKYVEDGNQNQLLMNGKAFFFGTTFQCATDFVFDGSVPATNRRPQYGNHTGATHDGVVQRDCKLIVTEFNCLNGDDFKFNMYDHSGMYIYATATSTNATYQDGALVYIDGITGNGATKRDILFNGLLDVTKRIGRPFFLFKFHTGLGNAAIYVINFKTNHAYYTDNVLLAFTFDTQTVGYTNPNGAVWLGYSANITIKDASGAPISGVTVGCKDSKGNAGWFSSKGASFPYTPTMIAYKTTDANGQVLDAWVIKGRIKWNGSANPNSHGAWFDSNYPVNPWELRFRKYGYIFSTLQQDYQNQEKSAEVPAYLTVNSFVVANEATALAYTGIAITGSTNTTTLSSARTMQALYDYTQAWASQGTSALFSEQITTSNGTDFTLITGGLIIGAQHINFGTKRLAGGTIRYTATGTYSPKLGAITVNFSQAGTYNLAGADFGGQVTFTNSSGGNVTVNLETGVDYVNTGPNITIDEPQVYQSVTVAGCVAGTRIQLYDTTNDTEIYNGTPTFPYTWTDSVPYSADKTIRLRTMYVSGTTAKMFTQNTVGTATALNPALSINVEQTDDAVYIANAINGSAVTGITIDDLALLVNISASTITWAQLYAYETYWLGTAVGIRDEGRSCLAKDVANYIWYNFKIKNVGSAPLKISGGYGVDSDGSSDLFDTTGLSIFPVVDHVVSSVVTVAGSSVITGDIDDVTAKVQAGMTAQGYTTTRAPKLDNLDATIATRASEANATTNKNSVLSAIGSIEAGGATAEEVRIEMDTNSKKLQAIANDVA